MAPLLQIREGILALRRRRSALVPVVLVTLSFFGAVTVAILVPVVLVALVQRGLEAVRPDRAVADLFTWWAPFAISGAVVIGVVETTRRLQSRSRRKAAID
jgi:hypothetical protein